MEKKEKSKEEKEKKEEKRKIPEKKLKIIEKLVSLIKKNNTIIVASIENLSSAQFQNIKRNLKKEANMVVVKKNLINKAIEKIASEKKNIKELEKHLQRNFVILFSNKDPFELSATLSENSMLAKAKAGQIAPDDIVIEAGPTDLPVGPIITEFAKANIQTKIEGGKIVIKETVTAVKKGERISEDLANILSRLELTPLSLSLEPLVAYNCKEDKIYTHIKVNKQKMLHTMIDLAKKALSFAVHINYPTKETIILLITKACQESNAINLINNK